jgi:hypothetical protein
VFVHRQPEWVLSPVSAIGKDGTTTKPADGSCDMAVVLLDELTQVLTDPRRELMST